MARRWMACLVLLCLLGGCAATAPPGETQASRQPGALHVVASHYPVYLAALQITRDVPGVSLSLMLAPQAGYMEDYRLSELDWLRAQAADVLILMGGGLEDFLPVFAAEGGPPLVVAAEHVLRIPGRARDPDEQGEPEDNPYIWLSPTRWGQAVDGIAAALAHIDPDHAQAYAAANDRAQEEIAAVAAQCGALSAALSGREAISLHPAIAYLAQEVGLSLVAQPDRDPSQEPELYQLEQLQGLLAAHPGAALLVETTAPLAWKKPGGHEAVQLNVLTYGAADGNGDAWRQAMQANLSALALLAP